MAKFALPIKGTYVPDWGIWECLREFVQNAQDEAEEKGTQATFKYLPSGKLVIHNEGADMGREVLIMGKTTKADRGDLRGQYGEGLNLAILAGVRAGLGIVIRTPNERWTASISPAKEFGDEEVLTLHTRKVRKLNSGVTVEITGLEADAWEENKKRFIFLNTYPDNKIVRVKGRGSILLGEEHRGAVYAKGVFVNKVKDLVYGYDLDRAKLDRDRRMVDVWNTQWEIAAMFKEAINLRPELLQPEVYKMLRDNALDTQHMNYHADDETSERLAAEFVNEHGENAVPVGNIQESADLSSVGRLGVVVPETLREVIQKKTGKPDDIVQESLRKINKTFGWHELTQDERERLRVAADKLDDAAKEFAPEREDEGLLMRVNIVEFADKNLDGTCDLGSGKINISRSVLTSTATVLCALVHEEAHAISEAGDGTREHVQAIEGLWMHLWTQEQS